MRVRGGAPGCKRGRRRRGSSGDSRRGGGARQQLSSSHGDVKGLPWLLRTTAEDGRQWLVSRVGEHGEHAERHEEASWVRRFALARQWLEQPLHVDAQTPAVTRPHLILCGCRELLPRSSVTSPCTPGCKGPPLSSPTCLHSTAANWGWSSTGARQSNPPTKQCQTRGNRGNAATRQPAKKHQCLRGEKRRTYQCSSKQTARPLARRSWLRPRRVQGTGWQASAPLGFNRTPGRASGSARRAAATHTFHAFILRALRGRRARTGPSARARPAPVQERAAARRGGISPPQ